MIDLNIYNSHSFNMKNLNLFIYTMALTLALSSIHAQSIEALGALEFNDNGVLFVGDNLSGAIHAIDLSSESRTKEKFEINVYNVDAQVAAILGTSPDNVLINDMAVHPKSGEVYLSVTRGHGLEALPALIKINAENELHVIALESESITSQSLSNVPDMSKQFKPRGSFAPPTIKEIAKAKRSLRMFSIMDMEYHNGELFVAGISNEEFCSVLRRMPYPFDGTESISNIEMFHIAHDQYESRAPIRSMLIKNIDGVDQIVAAYTCSPLVLIPLAELTDGAKV